MVIRDLSFSEARPITSSSTTAPVALPLASVTDRFIAFILDFLIFSPVVSFLVAGVLRNLKTVLLLNSESEEAVVIWALFLFGLVFFSCFLQALFLYVWQASPGQKFMQLQVISYPQALSENNKLSFAQCFLRPVGWWIGTFMLGVPFLEILGHPLRRAFHERASDTVVISLKQEATDFPLAVESRYISSTLWIFFGFMFVIGVTFMAKAYRTALHEGLQGSTAVAQVSCPDISSEQYPETKRLDVALALYFAAEVDEACVFAEAQKAVWSSQGEDKALGQLALAVVSEDDKEAAAYQSKVCEESAKSEACAISNYLNSNKENRGNILRRAGLGLVSSRILLLKNSMDIKNYASAVSLIKDLESEKPLRTYLDKNLVKAAWSLNAKMSRTPSRSPASNDEKDILEAFKKRYDLE